MFSNPEHIFRTYNWPLTYLVEITCLHLSHITTLFIPSVGWELQAKKKKVKYIECFISPQDPSISPLRVTKCTFPVS